MSQSNQSFQAPKMWHLSAYEQQRKPHLAITDDTVVAISPRSLHSELMCPICLDMLTNTMTTKECLHRFCHDCIITALRSGNKECPTCRKKLISKRSLRPDPNFDSLIEKIYPDREEYEEHQQQALDKLNKHTNQQALTMSIEEGLRVQAHNRLQRMLKQQQKKQELQDSIAQPEVPADETEATSEPTTPVSTPSRSKKSRVAAAAVVPDEEKPSANSTENKDEEPQLVEVEMILRPHPNHAEELKEESRYIKTTGNATMEHITQFLKTRLNIQAEHGGASKKNANITVSIKESGSEEETYTELKGEHTLEFVNDTIWKQNKPVEIFFSAKEET